MAQRLSSGKMDEALEEVPAVSFPPLQRVGQQLIREYRIVGNPENYRQMLVDVLQNGVVWTNQQDAFCFRLRYFGTHIHPRGRSVFLDFRIDNDDTLVIVGSSSETIVRMLVDIMENSGPIQKLHVYPGAHFDNQLFSPQSIRRILARTKSISLKRFKFSLDQSAALSLHSREKLEVENCKFDDGGFAFAEALTNRSTPLQDLTVYVGDPFSREGWSAFLNVLRDFSGIVHTLTLREVRIWRSAADLLNSSQVERLILRNCWMEDPVATIELLVQGILQRTIPRRLHYQNSATLDTDVVTAQMQALSDAVGNCNHVCEFGLGADPLSGGMVAGITNALSRNNNLTTLVLYDNEDGIHGPAWDNFLAFVACHPTINRLELRELNSLFRERFDRMAVAMVSNLLNVKRNIDLRIQSQDGRWQKLVDRRVQFNRFCENALRGFPFDNSNYRIALFGEALIRSAEDHRRIAVLLAGNTDILVALIESRYNV